MIGTMFPPPWQLDQSRGLSPGDSALRIHSEDLGVGRHAAAAVGPVGIHGAPRDLTLWPGEQGSSRVSGPLTGAPVAVSELSPGQEQMLCDSVTP